LLCIDAPGPGAAVYPAQGAAKSAGRVAAGGRNPEAMTYGSSSKLMAATPPAPATAFRRIASAQCVGRRHVLLAFVRQSDVKTSEPSLSAKARAALESCHCWLEFL